MCSSLLSLQQFGIGFDDKIVLTQIDLHIDGGPSGITVLMGPAGAGKSTLLRTLAGHNDAQPSLRVWGDVFFDGQPLSPTNRPVLVAQNARSLSATVWENLASALPHRSERTLGQQREEVAALLADLQLAAVFEDVYDEQAVFLPAVQQKCLALVRGLLQRPRLLMVDEGFAGLDDNDAQTLIDVVQRAARSTSLLWVTHHQQRARALGGRALLLAGGTLHADADVDAFLDAPSTEVAADFVRTGRTKLPSPNAKAEDLADGVVPPAVPAAAQMAPSHVVGPRDFRWLRRGLLGGLPRPGVVADCAADFAGLERLGIDVLVCLEEQQTVAPTFFASSTVRSEHFPIVDMQAPSVSDMGRLMQAIDEHHAAGRCVGVHCRAGMGRTGIVLVSHLIWRGQSAANALHDARVIHPKWVQSEAQLRFLDDFEQFVSRLGRSSSTTQPTPPTELGAHQRH